MLAMFIDRNGRYVQKFIKSKISFVGNILFVFRIHYILLYLYSIEIYGTHIYCRNARDV